MCSFHFRTSFICLKRHYVTSSRTTVCAESSNTNIWAALSHQPEAWLQKLHSFALKS